MSRRKSYLLGSPPRFKVTVTDCGACGLTSEACDLGVGLTGDVCCTSCQWNDTHSHIEPYDPEETA